MEVTTLEDVYKLHMNDLYHYLLQLSKHPQTAEDLVQDTFIKAYEHLESYRGEKVRPWLFRVAYNSFIDWYRREKKHIPTDPLTLSSYNIQTGVSPETEYLAREKLDTWLNVINTLPDKSRQIILLRDYYRFTYEEIAQILCLSLANVKVTLFRARQKVKEVLKDEL